ncbi:leucine rich repeat (LRR) protein [Anaeroplasma bactoclasticum]|uniref:Leucine rich repeat (LRR) protein n=2 Tax=Anaeroplasma bactoclasticum TaxID=2088 RepID=A0A397RZR7_9MOLU|nr:leucine rich repeat (LRR) protein [Anaeroplasma bactoclasticum]
MDKYNEIIDLMDYPTNYDLTLSYMWIHPEYIPKKIIKLGNYNYGFYKMPETHINYNYLVSKEPLPRPITVPIDDFKSDIFKNNLDITDLILSKHVSRLPKEAFLNMKNLKRIWIPKRITYIPKDCFKGCDSLDEIYYEGTKEEFDAIDIFYKQYRVIHKLGINDEIEEYYDQGNTPFINAKVYYNQIRNKKNVTEAIKTKIMKTLGGHTKW